MDVLVPELVKNVEEDRVNMVVVFEIGNNTALVFAVDAHIMAIAGCKTIGDDIAVVYAADDITDVEHGDFMMCLKNTELNKQNLQFN